VRLEEKLDTILQVLDTLDVTVRLETLGGEAGGVCRLKGELLVFIDLDADPQRRYDTVLSALAEAADLDNIYLLPEIRADLDKLQTP